MNTTWYDLGNSKAYNSMYIMEIVTYLKLS